jgi:UDP-N-acetyl-D-glucosamine dehydrogenase
MLPGGTSTSRHGIRLGLRARIEWLWIAPGVSLISAGQEHFDPVGRLRGRLDARTAKAGVIGLGYVGLPLVSAVARAGFWTLGLDIDPDKAARLNAGRSYIRHIPDDAIQELLATERFEATTDFGRVAELDVILICVPTPLSRHRTPDLTFIEATARAIAPHLQPGQLVVLESTTYPGTTAEVLKPILETSGLRSGSDLFLAYAPEREDPGNATFTTGRIPKVVGGEGEAALDLACTFYRQFIGQVVPVSSTATAEAVKLTENIFRAVNIALVNELKVVFEAMAIDVFEVIDAAKTKPFGYMPFYPGPGLGGHCIPIDPFYLTWKAHEYEIPTRFIELAGEINTAMPAHVVERLARALDARFGKGLNGARILLIGLAYKKNVDDIRESPALKIMDLLEGRGAKLAYHDPYVALIPPTREYSHYQGRRSTPLDADALARFDAALIVTDHDEIDWQALVDGIPLVVDTRNVTRSVSRNRERILIG